MKLTTIMYLHKMFNLADDWGVTQGVKRRKPKTTQNEQKIGFLAQFQVFFKNKITVTCLTHYVALHHWSKTFEMSKLENYK